MSIVGDYILSLSDETLDKLFKNSRMASSAVSINEEANEDLRRAYEDYKRVCDRTVDALDNLNKRKIKVMGREIATFVETFNKIRNIDILECNGLSEIKSIKFTKPDYKKMSNEVTDIYDYIVSEMKIYAIGGIILGGVIMGRKAKITMNNAMTNAAAAQMEFEKLETEKMELEAIHKLTKQEDRVIRRLVKISRQPIRMFEEITSKKCDWNEFTLSEKQSIASLMSLMKLLKLLIDQPVINKDGDICNEAYRTIGHKEILKLTQKGE